jgi:nucleoside-diphosphate-sugar epimerase
MNKIGDGKVLITGAAGWLGLNLVEVLIKGIPGHSTLEGGLSKPAIRCLLLPDQDDRELRGFFPDVEIVRGDVRSRASCAEFCRDAKGAVLFHIAGIIHPRRVRDFYDINLRGTANLLEAAQEAGVKRAVVMSSNSPCGCNPHRDHLFDEDSPYNPYMNYGRSKMLMEQEVKRVQAGGRLETVLIRAPWFYGPHQPPRQRLFFEMIRDGKGPIVGDGHNLRSMAFCENLAQGLILGALTEAANGKVYWIADERPYSMHEIMDTVERLLETEFGQSCSHKRMKLPGIASEVAWLVDKTLQGLGLYHQKFHVLSEMNQTIACTVERAKAELGYQPLVSLEEGMRRSLRDLFGEGRVKE